MPVGGCVLFAVASLVSFFSFVTFRFLPVHDPDSAGRRRAVACEALAAGHARSWVSGQSRPPTARTHAKAPVAPSRHARALCSLPDASNGNHPSRTVSRTLTLFGLGRVFYQRLSGLTRGKIHFFWGKAAFSGRAARKGCHWKLAGRPKGMPLEVGGPPERNVHWKAGKPRPTGLPRPPGRWQGRLAHQAGAFLGVLDVLGVLAQAPVMRSGQVPFQPPACAFPCAAKMAAFPVSAMRTALTGTAAF